MGWGNTSLADNDSSVLAHALLFTDKEISFLGTSLSCYIAKYSYQNLIHSLVHVLVSQNMLLTVIFEVSDYDFSVIAIVTIFDEDLSRSCYPVMVVKIFQVSDKTFRTAVAGFRGGFGCRGGAGSSRGRAVAMGGVGVIMIYRTW